MAHPYKLYSRLGAENLEIAGVAVAATALEINRAADLSARMVAAGSTLAVTLAAHAGKTIQLDTAAGSVCTLPAATGSGAVYRFVVTVLATTNSHKIQVTGTDVMRGVVHSIDTDTSNTAASWGTTSTSDTITLNRSTTGSVYIGEMFELTDTKVGFWTVTGWFAATGDPATPFTAAVP